MGTKRYFWLKLMGDFFDRTEIRLIEKAPHGKELVLLYLKLLCKSLETDRKARRYFLYAPDNGSCSLRNLLGAG